MCGFLKLTGNKLKKQINSQATNAKSKFKSFQNRNLIDLGYKYPSIYDGHFRILEQSYMFYAVVSPPPTFMHFQQHAQILKSDVLHMYFFLSAIENSSVFEQLSWDASRFTRLLKREICSSTTICLKIKAESIAHDS
uniref:Uncharacterized protein n=1 Tax=Micrurus paraensis TaxID=1970185 RepID=A0A2D4K903_9SAUR